MFYYNVLKSFFSILLRYTSIYLSFKNQFKRFNAIVPRYYLQTITIIVMYMRAVKFTRPACFGPTTYNLLC